MYDMYISELGTTPSDNQLKKQKLIGSCNLILYLALFCWTSFFYILDHIPLSFVIEKNLLDKHYQVS